MNLDIMSLMAASAAVADGSTTGAGLPGSAPGTQDLPSEPSLFSNILQALNAESAEDLALAAQADSALVAAAVETSLDPAAENAAAPPPTLPGAGLPVDGNPLPVVQANTLLASDLKLGPPTTQTPAPSGPLRTVEGVPTGWFSSGPSLANQPGSVVPAALEAERVLPLRSATPSANPVLEVEMPTPAGPKERLTTAPLSELPATRQVSAPAAVPVDVVKSSGPTPDVAALARSLRQLATSSGADASTGAQPATPGSSSLTSALISADSVSEAALLRPSVPALSSPTNRPTLEAATTTLPALNLAQPGWDKAMGQRLVMMASRGLDSAELRLDPPQLGTVQVKLAMHGDQTQLLMQVANPAAREALETALPRLRELLGEEGLQLDNAQVSERDTGRNSHSSDDPTGREWTSDGQSSGAEENADSITAETLTLGPGRIHERV
ncbi:MAG: flagellar hook-length control protein FliK [Gammaproteobacteria bacterium]